MTIRAVALVRERSRAKGSNRLVLYGIADVVADDGRDAFPYVSYLVDWSRLSDRGVRLVLHKLERDGEIRVKPNTVGQSFTRRDGSTFEPKWFIDVCCISDWAAYQAGQKPEKISDSFGAGRPRTAARESEKISDFAAGRAPKNRKSFPGNRKDQVRKPEGSGTAYKEGTITERSLELEQGAAPPTDPVELCGKPAAAAAGECLKVITRIAHEVIDVVGLEAALGELAEAVKSRCAQLGIAYDGDVVRRAIDSALEQRRRRLQAVR